MKRKNILLTVTAVLTVVLGAALCLSALAMYRNGMALRSETGSATAPVFTREAVGRQLRALSPLAALWLASRIAALAAGCAPAVRKPSPEPEAVLRRLQTRGGDVPPDALRERKNRTIVRAAGGGVIALCFLWGCAWLLDGSHFQSWELEAVMGAMLTHVLPPLVLGFGTAMVCVFLCDRSRRREVSLLQEALRNSPSPAGPAAGKTSPARPGKGALRGLLYAAAAVLIVLGVLNGGLRDVLVKAIHICTECIGLG